MGFFSRKDAPRPFKIFADFDEMGVYDGGFEKFVTTNVLDPTCGALSLADIENAAQIFAKPYRYEPKTRRCSYCGRVLPTLAACLGCGAHP